MRARSIILLVTTIFSAMVLSSCSSTEERGTPTQPLPEIDAAEWTVLVYGAGNNELDGAGDVPSEVFAMVENMRGIYTEGSVNVLACVSSSETAGQARLYDFPADPSFSNSPHDLPYTDLGSRDMSSPQTLQEFIELGMDQYSTEKYALILMGQGGGWHGALLDNANGNGQPMSLSAFQQAVEATSAHFDLLAWFVPGMNSIEVAYECRDIADYMVACAWSLAHDVSRSPRVWLQDLAANSQMDGERLGMMMVDGLYEAAEQAQDSVHYALISLSNLSANLVPKFDELAAALTPYTEDNTLELPSLWSAAWVAQTDDSQSVDVGRLSEEVLAEPMLGEDPAVADAAQQVIESLNSLTIYHRTTVGGEHRRGVSIYLPFYPDTTELAEYAALSLSSDHSGWSSLLHTTAENAPDRSQILGTVRWAGHELQNIYVFLNTNQFGSPNITGTTQTSVIEVIAQDEIRYGAYVIPDSASVQCYIGLFQDLDNSGSLTTGDRYGYYHQNASPPRDWITIIAGAELQNINVDLDRTF